MTIHPPTLAHLIADRAARDPDLDVLTFVDAVPSGGFIDEIRTYGQLWNNGQRLAHALIHDHGMVEGARFAVLMQNHAAFVDAMTGAAIAGAVFVPIDPRMAGRNLRYMLEFAGCGGVICADYALANLLAPEVLPHVPDIGWIWVLDTGEGLRLPDDSRFRWVHDILGQPGEPVEIRASDPDAPMQLLYTSGTTGLPKAILSSHARFMGVASLGGVVGLVPGDRPYTGLSLTHANAQLITLGNALSMGLRAVIGRRFTKSRLWDICRHYGCTTFNLLGGMTTALFSEPPRPGDRDHQVRFVLSAGMPAAIWPEFERRFGIRIFEFYGAAEGGLTLNPPGAGPIGSIGKPPPGLICTIRNARDHEARPYEQGEICFRLAGGGPPPVRYYRNEDATSAKVRGGWLRSGDIGWADEQGWFYFGHRAGGGIRRNGEFIQPGTVEKAVAGHPAVDDVFVYGRRTPANAPGESEVVAAVKPRDPGGFDPQSLFRHCAAVMPANHVPAFIQVVADIPKTASEKPQERFLAEAFESAPHTVFRPVQGVVR